VTDALLVAVVVIALVFDFTNGFHDTANAVATTVSTRALPPRVAVLVAAIANFAGAFVSTAVAGSLASGLIDPESVTGHVIVAGLIGAIAWNLATWYLGLPSSSSHALIGGLIGAALAGPGSDAVLWSGLWEKVVLPGLTSPVIGFFIAGAIVIAVFWLFRRGRPAPLNRGFRGAQVVSGTLMAFFHGTNDAQKTMGVIALSLYISGHSSDPKHVDDWVKVAAGAAIGLGTYVGGWRIMRTMGTRIVSLEPPQGFAAQAAATAVLWYTGRVGFPISTTQVISGAVLGAGTATPAKTPRWGVAANIAVAWVLTLPASGLVAAVTYELISPFTG
jgi:PiT family inorganic phosphate transporter